MSRTSSSRRRPPASRPKLVPKKLVPEKLVPAKPVQKKPGKTKPPPEKPSRKKAAPQSPLQRELSTKRLGELAELAFILKAANLGFGVARPFGDSERYDVILDARELGPRQSNVRRKNVGHKNVGRTLLSAAFEFPSPPESRIQKETKMQRTSRKKE
jgi:hypothetical protein